MAYTFMLTGGGTGGHVFPALAVANVLRERGHRLVFVGTSTGMEARIVPQAGYSMEFIESGALNRVGLLNQMKTSARLPTAILKARATIRSLKPHSVFSMGGYAAGPVSAAAVLTKTPLIVMEPNAIPGLTNRVLGKRVYRALLGFEATRRWFPPQRSEVTGLPVRAEFFAIQPKGAGKFTVLITGGSRGARALNRAARDSWPLFRKSGVPIRIVLQAGASHEPDLVEAFRESGVDGDVVPFITDMAGAFAAADLVIARAGAGSLNEIAAAGMPSVLVPFPFASDDHQRRNAEVLVARGAARMVLDAEFSGERLFSEVAGLADSPAELARMRTAVRQFANPGAAVRAADVLEEAARS